MHLIEYSVKGESHLGAINWASFIFHLFITGGSSLPCSLPVDPSLSTTTPTSSICTTLSMAPINLSDTLADHSQRVADLPKPPTVVVAEGLPPVTCHVVDSGNMSTLLTCLATIPPDHLTIINGQVIAVSTEGSVKKSRAITDILSWLQVFSILTAILVSAESTTKEEAGGLTAHAYLII